MPGVSKEELAEAAQMASWPTRPRRARSIVVLAKSFGVREHDFGATEPEFIPFTAATRMSGIDHEGTRLRKGAGDSVLAWVTDQGGNPPAEMKETLDRVAGEGGTPWRSPATPRYSVSSTWKDVVKEGMRERFAQLRAMGIRTVMVTGDNPDRGQDRRRGRCRFVPGRGDTRSEAGADPRGAEDRPHGRHDR